MDYNDVVRLWNGVDSVVMSRLDADLAISSAENVNQENRLDLDIVGCMSITLFGYEVFGKCLC